MAKVLSWKIIYADMSLCSSEEYGPGEVPIDGVQWIVEYLETGKRYVHGMDYYRWTGDSWAGGGIADLHGWLRTRGDVPIILYGLWISDFEYDKVREMARKV